jgi:uncharacterized membrane protein YqjE
MKRELEVIMARDQLSDQSTANPSTADLVRRVSEQVSTLVRDEIQLARIEMAEKGKRAGMGAAMFGSAGLVALYGVGALIAAGILALALALPAWASALIVGVVLLIIAAVAALLGRSNVKKAVPPVPAETITSVRADVDAVTTAVDERARR